MLDPVTLTNLLPSGRAQSDRDLARWNEPSSASGFVTAEQLDLLSDALLLNSAPHFLWRCWHIHMGDAEFFQCVDYSIHRDA